MISIYTTEFNFLLLMLHSLDKVRSDWRIEQQYFISFVKRSLNISILTVWICRIQHDHFSIFVGLIFFDFFSQFIPSEIFIIYRWIKHEFLCPFSKFLLRNNSVFHSNFAIIPFLLYTLSIIYHKRITFVSYYNA